MLKIKKGIFYYKLLIEKGDKDEPFKTDLLQFLFKQRLTESQLKSVNDHNFNSEENLFVKNIKFELNMKGKPQTKDVVFLFQTEMATDEFNDMIEGYFG